jgi:ribulose kinase
LHSYLNATLKEIANTKKYDTISELTKNLHILPDFHGNRSPLADPAMRGMVCTYFTLKYSSSILIMALNKKKK